MLAKTYQDMLGAKSVIREIFAYGTSRAEEIGKENVFDYSLGNPSVPAPQAFTDEMIRLLMEEEPVALHGYSPSLGIEMCIRDRPGGADLWKSQQDRDF